VTLSFTTLRRFIPALSGIPAMTAGTIFNG
jgi:hypothetical protein